jgi:hypothetical protein
MLNAAITPITTYAMCTIRLPRGVIENIDRIRKQCLWRGNSDKKKGGNLVAWETVQRPKTKGGLGVINLRLQNDALLLKHLHKFYNKCDIPWVQLVWFKYYRNKVPHATREVGSFWWKDIWRLNNIFRGFSFCFIGDGSSACFWEDRWTESILSRSFPRLASFAKSDRASVQEVVEAVNIDDIFWLPLSDEAMLELEDLQEILQGFQFDEDSNDIWRPVWGNDYSAKKFYDHIYNMVEGNPIFKIIWKSRCIPRVKFFFWLILVDRLNTKNMLSRRHIGERSDDFCVLCTAGTEETIDHLFFQCPFACQCWDRIGFLWDLNLDITDMIIHARRASNLKFFTEIVLLAAWE